MPNLEQMEITEPITPKELAARLPGRDVRTIRRMCKSGEIETFPLGIPYLIPANEANRILKNKIND